MDNDRLLYWIWLSLACKVGSVLPSTLLKYFSSPEKIYQATEDDFKEVATPFYDHEKALCNKDLGKAESILRYCRKNKIQIMTPDDFFYPEKFRVLPNKPIVLYYLGNFCDFDNSFVAGVVGAREPSEYGIHVTKRIAYDLARGGAVICSGMAKGVDAAAHKAALYAETFTVGLLGCGIDRVYPKENAALYEEVIRKGLLITEYPPGSPPNGYHFPIRNRLISALSDVVAVTEASAGSGALITAEYAIKQKKALYSVPGSIFSPQAEGSNFLLNIGAKPLLSAVAVLDVFQKKFPQLKGGVEFFGKEKAENKPKKKAPEIKKKIGKFVFAGSQRGEEKEPIPPQFEFVDLSKAAETEASPKKEKEIPLISLSEAERKLYIRLSFEAVSPETLVEEDESVSEILQLLTKLEMKGLVRKMPGGKFILTDRAEQ